MDRGPITFARFMEQALYCPKLGFYEQTSPVVGKEGSFVTSVSVGPLLGQLLAFQFARWLENITGKNRVLVEAGAHEGQLAHDILDFLADYESDLYQSVQYLILEPSSLRRESQEKYLKKHKSKVHWIQAWGEVPSSSFDGTILSNELLDAFPVHRIAWSASRKAWFEWGVIWENDDFEWASLEMKDGELLKCFGMDIPHEIEQVLPDGYVLDVSPKAGVWWAEAAGKLREGFLMTLDYGYEVAQLLKPERADGTLRAYRQQAVTKNLLDHVGQQDLTAHVNFTQLQKEGERANLVTDYFDSQARFLTEIASQTWKEGARFPQWDDAMKRQFQTLSHPNHFGNVFQALVQRKANPSAP